MWTGWRLGAVEDTTPRLNSYFFSAAIGLCVSVLVGVAASADFLRTAIATDARNLLAADLRLQASMPLQAFADQHVRASGRTLSPGMAFSAMARVPSSKRSLLVEVKAVSNDYPLRGTVRLEKGTDLREALSSGGAVAEKALLTRLGLQIGDSIHLGDATFILTSTLAYEPDRITHLFNLGPRIIIPWDRAEQTGLLQTGSRITWSVSVRLGNDENPADVARKIRAAAKAEGVRILTPEQSQPSVRRFVRRFALFLALTSLLTLLVGGLAMAGAMTAYLHESRKTIAILKFLGAENAQVVGMFLLSTVRMSWPASFLGALLGISLPGGVRYLLEGIFPVAAVYQPSLSLALAGAILGILFSLIFAAGPLLWAQDLSPGLLFRVTSWGEAMTPHRKHGWWVGLLVIGSSSMAVAAWSGENRFGLLFASGLVGMLLCAWVVAWALLFLLRHLSLGGFSWKLASSALLRREEGNLTVIMSLGLGLGLVFSVLFLEENLNQQMVDRLPQRTPSFFFIDIQPDQVATFREIASRSAFMQTEAVRIFPVVRGRLVPTETMRGLEAEHGPDKPDAWRINREYVLTYAEKIPSGNLLVAGQWWNHADLQEASVEVKMAEMLGLRMGDPLTFLIQGIPVTARISNLRTVRWSDMGLNFFVVFSPAVLQGVPLTYIASVAVPPEKEEAFLAEVTHHLHNVTAIATRTIMESVRDLLHHLARAVRFLGGTAVVAGLLVLSVSVMASRRRRAYETAIYRLIGSTRHEVARVAMVEFALLGCMASVTGVVVGQVITALAVRGLMNDVWEANMGLTLVAFLGGTATILLTGWVGSYQALGRPVMVTLHAADL